MVIAGQFELKKMARVVAITLVATATSVLVTACQNDPDIDITKLSAETDPPEVLYNQGLANLNAGKTTEAARKFDAIDQQHPFSEYARKALVMRSLSITATASIRKPSTARPGTSTSIPSPKTQPMRNTLSVLPIPSRSRR